MRGAEFGAVDGEANGFEGLGDLERDLADRLIGVDNPLERAFTRALLLSAC